VLKIRHRAGVRALKKSGLAGLISHQTNVVKALTATIHFFISVRFTHLWVYRSGERKGRIPASRSRQQLYVVARLKLGLALSGLPFLSPEPSVIPMPEGSSHHLIFSPGTPLDYESHG
jgi:hypothetical protein